MAQGRIFNAGADEAYNNEEYTPPEIYLPLGRIDLDPCAGEGTTIGAKANWTKADKGLSREWPREWFAFVNPPFTDPDGKITDGDWKKQMADLCKAHGRCILLLPWSAGAEWQQYTCEQMDSVFVFSSRIKYMRPGHSRRTNAKFGSALFAFGEEAHERLKAYRKKVRGTHLQRVQ